ncbi:MAG: hypothetical protein ACLFNK_00585 [Candidatus Woesearchaeota archaeon]
MRSGVFLVLTFLLLLPCVYASNLHIEIRDGEVEEIVPFKYNLYYQEKFYMGAGDNSDAAGRTAQDDKISIETESDIEYHLFSDIDYKKDYEFIIDGVSQEVSFCNDDGQCQPCHEGLCRNVENHLTCPGDCSSGSDDNYCDLKRDGNCDSDCEEYDFDCDACLDNVCLYEGMEIQSTSCSDMGGDKCSPREECDGYMTYADDVGMDCCMGECVVDRPDKAAEENTVSKETQESGEEIFIKDDEQDDHIITYLILMSVFMMITVVLIVIDQGKKMKLEHKIREYVRNMIDSGYAIDQVEAALNQQGYDQDMIKKICRHYR